jgi:hypothetical protein
MAWIRDLALFYPGNPPSRLLLNLGEGTIRIQFVALTIDQCNQRKISFLQLIEGVPSPMFPVQSERDVPFFNSDLDGHFLKSPHQVRAQVKFP